jgi:hypothetical protein
MYGIVKYYDDAYPITSNVHKNPYSGAAFLFDSSQCSLNKNNGNAPVIDSLPNPIASFPSAEI